MDFYLVNGLVYHNHSFQPLTLHVVDGTLHICQTVPTGAEIVDVGGKHIVPGFIDIHTHGAVGVDVNGATTEDLRKIGRYFAHNGTTAWLGSVLTDTREQTDWCIGQFRQYGKTEGVAELLGVHLEGPFLCTQYKGAMPEHLLQEGNEELLRHYQQTAEGFIRYLTVSPEVAGVSDMIPVAKELGICVGIGHSGATYQQSMEAIEKGANLATHTFNAMRLFHQHEPAIMGAVLESDVYCEMICDGLHLVPASVRLLAKVKGMERLIAITDSIMATGLQDGRYRLGVNEIDVVNGDAKIADSNTRAGSTLTQNRALKNLLTFTGKTLEELIPTLTENPATLLGLQNRIGFIEDGRDADLVVLDENNDIAAVYLKGQLLA